MKSAMRHQHTDHKCETISDCSYSGKNLVEKRLFSEVMEIDTNFDPFHYGISSDLSDSERLEIFREIDEKYL